MCANIIFYQFAGDGRGFCRSLFMFLLGLLFVMMASGFALLWVYAGGDLSAKNIRKTMPVLRRDVDAYFLTVGKKAEVAFEGARPYVKVFQIQLDSLSFKTFFR